MTRLLLIGALAFVFTSGAWAEDGWTGFGDDDDPPVAGEPANPGSPAPQPPPSPSPAPTDPAVAPKDGVKGDPGMKGDKGDKGDQGPQGIQGIQGVPGVNADLCSNLPGIQSTPGFKRWPQRYWRFKPRLEPRVLALNRKHQIVCVTQHWIRSQRLRARGKIGVGAG